MNETNDKNENHKGEKTLEQFIEEKLSSKGSKNVEEGTNENKLKKWLSWFLFIAVVATIYMYFHKPKIDEKGPAIQQRMAVLKYDFHMFENKKIYKEAQFREISSSIVDSIVSCTERKIDMAPSILDRMELSNVYGKDGKLELSSDSVVAVRNFEQECLGEDIKQIDGSINGGVISGFIFIVEGLGLMNSETAKIQAFGGGPIAPNPCIQEKIEGWLNKSYMLDAGGGGAEAFMDNMGIAINLPNKTYRQISKVDECKP